MYRELTNLLPSERSRAFRREYFVRLGTVALGVFTFVVLAAGAMLAPSYFLFAQELASKQAELALLSNSLEAAEEKEVGTRLAQLESDAQHLARLAERATASEAFRAVLAVPRDGITISSLAYAPGQAEGQNSLVVTGTASTRDTLRRYSLALSLLPFVEKSNLPISAYAAEVDLPFTITLTGTMKP